MKILLVSFYYHPEVGAAPSRMHNMAKGLKSLGADVEILTCLPNYPKGKIFEGYRWRLWKHEEVDGCKTYRYWTYATVSKNPIARGLSMVSYALTMWLFGLKRSTIKSYDCVIIQCPPLPVGSSALTLLKKVFGCKCVLNISDLWPLSAVELGVMKEGSKIHKIFSKLEKYNYRTADAIFGQSNEILRHIDDFEPDKPKFLYRNLQKYEEGSVHAVKGKPLKIVYAGLLGVAQDIKGIIENVDFAALGAEFHIYGGGNQAEAIKEMIANGRKDVVYHGYVSKEQIGMELGKYDVSLVPLAVRIRGAVPSKIFDILPLGIPVLFCGGGEGAEIIREHSVGLVSEPGDYAAICENISQIASMSDEEFKQLSERCINVSQEYFNFDKQMKETLEFLEDIVK